MTNAEQKIMVLRREFGTEELKRLFIKRLDDDLFEEVGAASLSIPDQRKTTSLQKIWRGYEILTGSIYLTKSVFSE